VTDRLGEYAFLAYHPSYIKIRKTAIAVDTIINQKRFNDAADES